MNWWSVLTLSGVNSMLDLGNRRPLEIEDVGVMEERERVAQVYKVFESNWAEELALDPEKRSLFRALRRSVDAKEQLWGLFLSMIAAGGACGPPLILRALSNHFGGSEVLPKSTLWILVALLLFVPVICSICTAHSYVIFAHTACMFRSALVPAVYNKSLVLGSQSRSLFSVGRITNLFSTDIINVQVFVQQFAADIFSPGQLALALGLVYREVGVSMFVGLGLVVAVLPLLLIVFVLFAKSRVEKSQITDFRIKLTNEILSGIRILKYYAWEVPFYEKIDTIRNAELKSIAYLNFLLVFIVLLITAIPYVMPIVVFFAYAAMNGEMDITVAFTTLALLGLITGPIMNIPGFLQRFFMALISLNRITEFLVSGVLQQYIDKDAPEVSEDGEYSIVFDKASLAWLVEEDQSDAASRPPDISKSGDIELVATEKRKPDFAAVPSAEADVDASPTEMDEARKSDSDTYRKLDQIEEGKSDPINRSFNTLMNISFGIKKGELVGIVGNVGSGKSSLLAAILGELQLKSGHVSMSKGTIAYHSQQTWILNANVRDNILLGAPMDEERLRMAIEAASLRSDIAILPGGLNTEIGEKGINLSGGQKARVSFARAVYRNADIYLLGMEGFYDVCDCLFKFSNIYIYFADDPLSAVDAHVGQHIFTKGICEALKGKTIVLVTHQVHLLDRCDKIMVIRDGCVQVFGTPEEVKKKVDINALAEMAVSEENPAETAKALAKAASVLPSEEDEAPIPQARYRADSGYVDVEVAVNNIADAAKDFLIEQRGVGTTESEIIKEVDMEEQQTRSRSNTASSQTKGRVGALPLEIDYSQLALEMEAAELESRDRLDSHDDIKSRELRSPTEPKPVSAENQDTMKKAGSLMTIEERTEGAVNEDVYWWFIRKGGWFWYMLCVIVAVGGAGSFQYSSFWLAEWGEATGKSYVENGVGLSDDRNMFYLNRFALLSIMGLVSVVLRTLIMIKFAYNASRKLHRRLLLSVLNSPVSFFDTTPLGRVLNRFSSDIATIDENLASNMGFVLGMITSVSAAIGAIAYTTTGTFVALAIPLIIMYYRIQLYFRKTNTELKRLENISRSPIYTEFNQALVGASSLRAYGEQDRFIARLSTAVDRNSSVQIAQQLIKWWLTVRLDTIGGLVSCFVAALCAGDPGFISVSYLSLSLSSAFAMVGWLKWLVALSADVEASMNSAERIKYYTETLLPEETPEVKEKYKAIAPDWPTEGRIEATNMKMSYKNGPLVLKGISFSVDKMEKIGIAGRTGCGKSSLMVALFRIENLKEGSLKIDDVDINSVSLLDLRSRIGIIPQDAVIFSLTVRFNLDPFNNHTDEEIWNVLEAVEMKDTVMSFPGKLEEPVADGGENFSMGQRQLICIARVLLRKPKVLVMDEATASVDNETDALVQRMIRDKFKNCTVLTIAHRLHTVIDSDRIMLLSAGNLMEFDDPKKLIEKPDGMFASLWNEHVKSHQTH
jgi:ABC-type multidrug transport system fused ATPase/permease subunit